MPKYARKKRATSAPKRRYYAKKKTTYRPKASYQRKRTNTRRLGSGSYAQRMQDQTFQYVKKKYTFVEPIVVGVGDDSALTTVSIMGGKNSTTPANCLTLRTADPDSLASNDMSQHQHFKITGCQVKIFWPEGTTPEATPVQWCMAYSGS